MKMTIEDEAILSLFHFVEEVSDLPGAENGTLQGDEPDNGETVRAWGKRLVKKFEKLRDETDEKYDMTEEVKGWKK